MTAIPGPKGPNQVLPWRLTDLDNIGHCLGRTAEKMPNAIAVACPARGQSNKLAVGQTFRYDRITFEDLEHRSNQIAQGLRDLGIQAGCRVALMVPPGIEFVTHVFALYKTGAVTILIDPGMGRKNMIQCLADSEPEALVGIPKAQLASWIFRRKLAKCRIRVCVDGWFPGSIRSAKFLQQPAAAPPSMPEDWSREAPAAIIFTTGSTGPPKGVLYRHRNFIEQCEQIRDYFDIQPGTVDVSGFPLFALFNSAMGTTTVFPQMDATQPARIHPPNLIDAVQQFGADQSFGSPALWNTVSRFGQREGIRLEGMQRVLTAGAPVPPHVLERVKSMIATTGDVFTPYGATEALPVACQSATEVLSETAERTHTGDGTCVGQPFSGIEWKVIEISDKPLESIQQVHELPQGEIGEVMVRGPVVTDQYVTGTSANPLHKVKDGDTFWHRMGDVGYLDEQNRFWFCGRKSHRVTTANGPMFTVRCEAICNTHPSIYRSALVGVGPAGDQQPVMILEPLSDAWSEKPEEQQALIDEVRQLAAANPLTATIQHWLIRQSLPVDIRHNSKIFREQLRPWATEQLRANTV